MHQPFSITQACRFAAAGFTFALPAFAGATVTLSGAYDNNPTGDGYDTSLTELYVVTATASFDNNEFAGLYDSTASLRVDGGSFSGNAGGALIITTASNMVTVNGGSFSNNLSRPTGGGVGLDVYGASLTINQGDFSGNVAYGLEAHSPTTVYGGTFLGNGIFGIAATTTDVTVLGGTFQNNAVADFSVSDGVIRVVGSFDHYGTLTGNGTFTGTLAGGGGVQTFSYITFSGGTVVLSAVPELPTGWLLLAGLAPMLRYRRVVSIVTPRPS